MRSMAGINRRRFLLAAAAPLEFNKRLRGPILSAPADYTSEHAVDHKGMRRKGGARGPGRGYGVRAGQGQQPVRSAHLRAAALSMKLANKVAIVTGSGRGIGRAAALELA